MSYTISVKESLCKKNSNICCKKAELYGFLLFSGVFNRNTISFKSENEFIIKRYEDIFRHLHFTDFKKTERRTKKISYIIQIDPEFTSSLISKIGDVNVGPPLRIDYSAFEDDCCSQAFLRGVFLGGGFICSPEKSYHLEIRTGHQMLADDLIRFGEEYDIHFKSVMRKGIRVLYLKSSDSIRDFLAYIGASSSVFDFINAEFEKNLKNNVNRAVNCENANIEKSIAAAQKQIKTIKKLKNKNYMNVSPELIALAETRLANPDANLEELGKKLSPPLSKSGVAHRMKKLTELIRKR
ncbi:MAG: DNA-binding protein WhiA [Clostridia bacterium]|nr:DNA-binding protein WhiA [Clostridia bacterium]